MATILRDAGLSELVESQELECLARGFQFTEGPLWCPDGSWLFQDIKAEKTYRIAPDRTVQLLREQTRAANGQTYGFTQTYPMPVAYNPYTFLQPAPGGTLQSLALYVQLTNPNMCWCYATAGLVNPVSGLGTPYFNLIGDYISNQAGASYPGRGVIPPEQGEGLTYSLDGGGLDSGDTWGFVCPDYVQWDIHSASVELVTSSAVGNRYLNARAEIFVGPRQYTAWQNTISTPIPAGTTVQGVWDGYGNDYQNGGTLVRGLMPRRLTLHGADAFGSFLTPVDLGDMYSYITMQVTERYTPNADLNPE